MKPNFIKCPMLRFLISISWFIDPACKTFPCSISLSCVFMRIAFKSIYKKLSEELYSAKTLSKNINLPSKPAKTFICVSWSCSCIVHLSDFTFRSVPLQHMVEVDSHGHFLKERLPEPPTCCGLNMWNFKKEIHFAKGALSSTYFSSKFSFTLHRLAGR